MRSIIRRDLVVPVVAGLGPVLEPGGIGTTTQHSSGSRHMQHKGPHPRPQLALVAAYSVVGYMVAGLVDIGHCGCRSDLLVGRAGRGSFAVMDDSSHPNDVRYQNQCSRRKEWMA